MDKILLFLLSVFISVIINGQNPRVDGYKGIWFTLGQFSGYGDKYSGGLGTYTADHIPVAIYCPEVKKTFFTYGGTTGADKRHLLIMISYYDHVTGKVPKPVIVYDKDGVDDPHDNAAISLDNEGYIWVFVSGRSTSRPGFLFKGTKPYSIDSFEMIRKAEMTYPQPWWIKGEGFLYLFTKYTNGRELYWSTSKDGKSWAADQKLAGLGGHYQVTNMHGKKLVSVFNYHPGGNVDKRTNLYAVQTEDLGKTWKTLDGKIIKPPLSDIHNEALVRDYEAEKKLVYINDLNFDNEGNPVILAVISQDFRPGPNGDPREWTIFHWKNGKWDISKVCTSTHNYDMGSLYIEKKSWKIIGPTEAGPEYYGSGGEVAVWVSNDEGQSWKKEQLLTSGSSRNHGYVRRPLNADNQFYAYWADGNSDRLSESHLYFANSNGTVYELPYNLKEETASPIKISSMGKTQAAPPAEHGTKIFPPVSGAANSKIFSVKINGEQAFTEQYKTYNYLHLSTASAFQVSLSYPEAIAEINISPSRYEIRAATGKNSTSFVIPGPGYYVVRINKKDKLFILADEHCKGPGKDTVNILSSKVDNSGRQIITTVLQSAINSIAGTGKTLYFPAGIYTTGSLSIPSNTSIFLEQGAVLKAAEEISMFDFHDAIKPKSFIRIKDARNVVIRGRGIIDGNGRSLRDKYSDDARMRLLLVLNSRNITLDGIFLRDPGSWNTHVLYSEDVTIRNIKMLNDIDLSNTDGFDPDASQNIMIENCFAYCSDDNVAIKTTGSSDYLRNVENITVRGCVFLTKKSSLKVGTESRGEVMKKILFENNDVVECDRGMALYCSDGALYEDIRYVNNRFEDSYPDAKQSFMNFTITKRNPDSKAGIIRNVVVKDCSFMHPFPKMSELKGFDKDHALSVIIENMVVGGKLCTNYNTAGIKTNEFCNLTYQ